MRPLLYLRKRNILGPMFGRYAGIDSPYLIKSAYTGGSALPPAILSADLEASVDAQIGQLFQMTRSGAGASSVDHDGMVPVSSANEARFIGARTNHNIMPGLNPAEWSNPPTGFEYTHGIDSDGEYIQITATAVNTLTCFEDINTLTLPLNSDIKVTNRYKIKPNVTILTRFYDGNTGATYYEQTCNANTLYDICPGEAITVATGARCGINTGGIMLIGNNIRIYHVSCEIVDGQPDTVPADMNVRHGTLPELANQHWDGVNVNNTNVTGEMTWTGTKWQFSNTDTGSGGYWSIDKSLLGFESVLSNHLAITRVTIDVTVSNITSGSLGMVVWHGYVGNSVSQDLAILGVGKHLLTFVHDARNLGGELEDYFWVQLNNAMLAGDSFTFTVEEITHKAINYGSFADGADPSDKENGNTVASNLVTTANGLPISETLLHGFLSEGSATNGHDNSENRKGSQWAGTNVVNEARTVLRNTPLGLRGAVRFNLNVGTTVYGAKPRMISGGTAPQTAFGISTMSIFARCSERYLGVSDFNDRAGHHISFDTQNNMAIVAQGGSIIFGGAVPLPHTDGWYWIYVSMVNTSFASNNFHVCTSTQPDTANTFWNSTGSEWIECTGFMHQDGLSRPSWYVPADGSTVTKNADSLAYELTDVFPTIINELTVSLEIYSFVAPIFSGIDRILFHMYNTAGTRGLKIGYDSSGKLYAEKLDGTTTRLTMSTSMDPLTRYKIMYGFSNVTGEYLVVNGTSEVTSVDVTPIDSLTGIIRASIGSAQTTITHSECMIKNVRIYDEFVDASTAEGETA